MHEPVLQAEAVDLLAVRPGGTYVDCTVGGGGHAAAILQRLTAGGRLLGLDRDPDALIRAGGKLAGLGGNYVLAHGSFSQIRRLTAAHGIDRADGVMADLGLSSDQLDDPRRGFSFQLDGPLDMRMDPTSGPTAAALLARTSEEELARILRVWGEEPDARRIAGAIVRTRKASPIITTGQLAERVAAAKGGRRGRIHPATRTFMALRIAVNGELDELEQGLEAALGLLAPGGRLAIISFHSLEDRIVKQRFLRHEGRWESLAEGGRRWHGEEPAVRRVTRKAVSPSREELLRNPRGRSARLRVVERMG